jgi:subtilase family serine protease
LPELNFDPYQKGEYPNGHKAREIKLMRCSSLLLLLTATASAAAGLARPSFFTHFRRPNPDISISSSGARGAAVPAGYTAQAFYPPQLYQLYNFPATSARPNIAVIEFSDTTNGVGGFLPADLTHYWSLVAQQYVALGYPAPTQTPNVVQRFVTDAPQSALVGVNQPGHTDTDIEIALDIELIGGLFPDFNVDITVYFAPNTAQGQYNAFQAILNASVHSVVSISWGESEFWDRSTYGSLVVTQNGSRVDVVTAMLQQANAAVAAGISIFASAGDSLASNGECTPSNVNLPASTPGVVAVGGTRLLLPTPPTVPPTAAPTTTTTRAPTTRAPTLAATTTIAARSPTTTTRAPTTRAPTTRVGVTTRRFGFFDRAAPTQAPARAHGGAPAPAAAASPDVTFAPFNYSYAAGALETVWNGNCASACGTGGGYSLFYEAPPYQQAALTGTPSGASSLRGIPDVASVADPSTGVYIYLSTLVNCGLTCAFPATPSPIGGTSASAPLWAALWSRVTDNGFVAAAPLLYALPPSQSFHDVTAGNNVAVSSYGTFGYSAASGYDLCTGLGTPNGAALKAALVT